MSQSPDMDPFTFSVGALSFAGVFKALVDFLAECKELCETNELGTLVATGERTRNSLANIQIIFAKNLDFSSSLCENSLAYKCFCESSVKMISEFKQNAKSFNNEVQIICGGTGDRIPYGPHGLIKLVALKRNRRKLQILQDRLSSCASSINVSLLTTIAYKLEDHGIELDQILQAQSRQSSPTEDRKMETDGCVRKAVFSNSPLLASNLYHWQKKYLDNLYEKFNLSSAKTSPKGRLLISVFGDEGVGKTRLSSEFAAKYRDSYAIILWIDAEFKGTTQLHVQNDKIKDYNPENSREEAIKWLSLLQEPWLLILDGFNELEDWKAWIPDGSRGHVLVTTEQPLPGANDFLHIQGIGFQDAQDFLLWESGFVKPWSISDLSWVQQVTDQLEDHDSLISPLTLVHVGAAIRSGLISPGNYAQAFEDRKKMQTKAAGKKDGELAFEVAIAQILKQQTQSSQDAVKLLKVFPFLPTSHVPFQMVSRAIATSRILKEGRQWSYRKDVARSNVWRRSWRRTHHWNWKWKWDCTSAYTLHPEDRQSLRFVDPSRALWALAELLDMSLVIHNQINDTYSMNKVVMKWITARIQKPERDKWKSLAEMVQIIPAPGTAGLRHKSPSEAS